MAIEGDRRISVLIVEDTPIYREALEGNLRAQADLVEVVGWADRRESAVSLVEQYVPDIVLLDLVLFRDRRAGIEVIRDVRRISPTTQVVVLTAYFDDDLIFEAIHAGAAAYLVKDNVGGAQLASILTSVQDGHPPMDPQIARRLYHFFQSPGAGSGEPVSPLTAREEQVLELIAAGRSNRDIAERLVIAEKTVKTHVSNILHKLHKSNRTELTWWWRYQQYAENPTPPEDT